MAHPDLLSSLLDDVIDLPEAERPSFFEAVEQTHGASVAQEVRALLDDYLGGAPLRKPVAGFAMRAPADPAQATALLIDRVLHGRYEVIRVLGKGNMGSVLLARDRNWAKGELRVAIKCAPVGRWGDILENEAEILCGISHPNIPTVTDYFIEDGRFFLVMRYIAGDSLSDVLRRRKDDGAGGLELDQVADWARTALKVLAYLHADPPRTPGVSRPAHQPIHHRDIKPSNLVVENGNLYVVDLGVASGGSDATAGITHLYAPPELIPVGPLAQPTGADSPRSDLYSLALTLYELLTAEDLNPLCAERRMAHRQQAPGTQDPLDHALATTTAFPPPVAQWLQKALAYDAHNRFESATEMRDGLEAALRHIQPQPDRHGTVLTPRAPRAVATPPPTPDRDEDASPPEATPPEAAGPGALVPEAVSPEMPPPAPVQVGLPGVPAPDPARTIRRHPSQSGGGRPNRPPEAARIAHPPSTFGARLARYRYPLMAIGVLITLAGGVLTAQTAGMLGGIPPIVIAPEPSDSTTLDTPPPVREPRTSIEPETRADSGATARPVAPHLRSCNVSDRAVLVGESVEVRGDLYPGGTEGITVLFGDGARASRLPARHIYRRAGSYQPRISVRTPYGEATCLAPSIVVSARAQPPSNRVEAPPSEPPAEPLEAAPQPEATHGDVIGVLLDEDGRPLVRASVRIGERNATTNASGRFSASHLPAGRYTITVRAEGYRTRSFDVEVQPGQRADVTFRMRVTDIELGF